MKHTPGPWVVHFSRAQVDAFDGEDGQPLPVCKLLWPIKKRSEAETRANANLIAAAPDLLAACKSAADDDCFCRDLRAMGPLTPGNLRCSVCRCREAISLAEGRDHASA
jgi:hypothetical protein